MGDVKSKKGGTDNKLELINKMKDFGDYLMSKGANDEMTDNEGTKYKYTDSMLGNKSKFNKNNENDRPEPPSFV